MTHDPSVINLKDLRKKAEAAKAVSIEIPPAATVVLRPSVAVAPAPVPVPAVAPPVVPQVEIPKAPPQPKAFVPPQPKTKRTYSKALIAAFAVGGIVALGGVGGGAYYIYTHIWTVSPFDPTPGSVAAAAQSAAAANPAEASANAAAPTLSQAEIVSRVAKLMLLPQGEEPVLAAVSDTTALSGQSFFKNAKVGDIVLMYGKARRAILYDAKADKVIEVAPITDSPQQ